MRLRCYIVSYFEMGGIGLAENGDVGCVGGERGFCLRIDFRMKNMATTRAMSDIKMKATACFLLFSIIWGVVAASCVCEASLMIGVWPNLAFS